MSYYAVCGSVSGPFGTIKVTRGRGNVRYLGVRNTTGVGDCVGGTPTSTFSKGNPVYEVTLAGVLYAGTNSEAIGNTYNGTAACTIQFGANAEQWSGTLLVTQASINFNFETGEQLESQIAGIFTGAVTITDATG